MTMRTPLCCSLSLEDSEAHDIKCPQIMVLNAGQCFQSLPFPQHTRTEQAALDLPTKETHPLRAQSDPPHADCSRP